MDLRYIPSATEWTLNWRMGEADQCFDLENGAHLILEFYEKEGIIRKDRGKTRLERRKVS